MQEFVPEMTLGISSNEVVKLYRIKAEKQGWVLWISGEER